MLQTLRVDVPEITPGGCAKRQIEHLIEVAVEYSRQPIDTQYMAAHETRYSIGIEVVQEQLLVGLPLTGLCQKMFKSIDGQIGERQQPVEANAKLIT